MRFVFQIAIVFHADKAAFLLLIHVWNQSRCWCAISVARKTVDEGKARPDTREVAYLKHYCPNGPKTRTDGKKFVCAMYGCHILKPANRIAIRCGSVFSGFAVCGAV